MDERISRIVVYLPVVIFELADRCVKWKNICLYIQLPNFSVYYLQGHKTFFPVTQIDPPPPGS